MIGKTLGHYQITEKLGEGGMGIVYKARDTHLDRFVAIKVLPPEKVADPERKRRFIQEAKAASALNHNNIITIHDITQEGGTYFIVMEYVEGKTLDQRIGHRGLRLNDLLKCAVQIADALAKAHSAGIVHRDLKPTNIMVNEDGVVKVLDFGLAKLTEQVEGGEFASTVTVDAEGRPITEEGVIIGTVAYMSPEQAEGKKVDARSDIFSFGSVLYEMVTGQKAFQGTSRMSTLSAILHQEPKPVSGVTPAIPADLEKLINRCLRKDAAKRFQHMDDVKVALEELKEESDSGRLSASSVALPRHGTPLWLILTAAALVIVTAAGLAWWLLHRPPAGAELKLSRFTFDSGLTLGGAISADGKLVTYASDRNDERNLDIYVQQIAGRQPIRITSHPADDIAPKFSPDGSKIVLRSARDGGGIYVVDTLGGEERKIADGGFSPSYSPDGSLILYTVMPPAGDYELNRMYLVPSQGGDPKPFQEEFGVTPMYGGAPAPIWSPDGEFVLFSGIRAKEPGLADWWVAPLSGGEPVRTGASPSLRSTEWTWRCPTFWSGNRVFFSAGQTHAEGASIYSVPITPGSWQISGPIRRLTSGPGLNFAFSVTSDQRMGISALKGVSEICSISLEPAEGRAAGVPQQLTRDEISKISPAISRDGSRMAYVVATVQAPARIEIRLRETADGRESTITGRGTAYDLLPKLSADGSVLAYQDFYGGKVHSFLVVGREGTPRQVCEECEINSFFPDPKEAIVLYRNETVRQNLSTGERIAVVKKNAGQIPDADLSPDGRWLALVLTRPSGGNAIHVLPVRTAPVSEKEWVLIAEEDTVLDSPRWSADGNLLYFVSGRDGRPCIWAQRLQRDTRQLTGPAFEVYHEGRARFTSGPRRYRKISVARDRLITIMIETTGNVWMADLGSE